MLKSVMSFIQIKNVPQNLHDAVRRRAAEEGVTMSEYVLELLEKELALPSRRQWRTQLASRQAVAVIAAEELDAVRQERGDELIES